MEEDIAGRTQNGVAGDSYKDRFFLCINNIAFFNTYIHTYMQIFKL